MRAENTTRVTLHLLSGFTLTVDDRRLPLIGSAQRVLAFLALQPQPLARAYVAGVLWPDSTSAHAGANLRSALRRVPKADDRIVDTSAQQLAVAAGVTVDVTGVRARAERLLDRAAPCGELLTPATRADLSVDILPDWYDDDWLTAAREQFHQLRIHALEAMCERLTAAGRLGEAVDAGLAAARAEPLRESAHHVLVRAHLAAGNRVEAMRQYERCRRLLRDELGLEPASGLRALSTSFRTPASLHK